MAGFSQGGGVGLALANWMVDGDPGFDVWAMDVARYRRLRDADLDQRQGARELFPPLPHPLSRTRSFRPAGRYQDHADPRPSGGGGRAVRADRSGWRCRCGSRPRARSDAFSWRRSTDFDACGRRGAGRARRRRHYRHHRLRQVPGDGTGRGGLARPAAGRANCRRPGRMALAPMLKRRRQADRRLHPRHLGDAAFLLAGSGAAEDYYMRWFEAASARGRLGQCERLDRALCRPVDRRAEIARGAGGGDRTRTVSHDAFRFMDIRRMDRRPCAAASSAGSASPAIWATRSGCSPDYQRHVFERLRRPARRMGIRDFRSAGAERAAAGKELGGWAREYRPVYGADEAGLGPLRGL